MGVKGMECLWDTMGSQWIVIHLIVWVCLEIGVYRYTLEIAIFLWENDDKSWDGTCLYSFFAFSTAI
jgi:hypothetical protein